MRTPFFTLFNVLLRSFPLSTGSQKETLVCARLSLRFLTFFYALFPFPQDHRERRLCVHAFLHAFQRFFTLFSLFHRITERDACWCTPFFTIFNVLLRSFPLSTGSQKETLVCARLPLRFLTFFYALFSFPQDHRERRLCVHAFLHAFQRFFTLFSLFHRITERDACWCTPRICWSCRRW